MPKLIQDVGSNQENTAVAVNAGSSGYVLPIASATILGGIRVGQGLTIDPNTGILNATGTYALPVASNSILGGIKVDNETTFMNGETLVVPGAGYSLPIATTAVLGGVIIGPNITSHSNGQIDYVNPNPTPYTLPVASTTQLGGVKVDGTTITVNGNGVISGAYSYSLPPATNHSLGGLIVGDGLAVASNGLVTANAPTPYTLPIANASTLGGVKTGANVTVNATTGVVDYLNPNPTPYSLPVATGAALGGIKVGANLTITNGALDYSLPIASSGVLGGIKVGNNLTINSATGTMDAQNSYVLPAATNAVLGGIIAGNAFTIAANGLLNYTNPNPTPYSLPVASPSVLGGIKVDGTVFSLNASNDLVFNNPNPTPYSLPVASSSVLGGVKIGSTLTLNASNQLDYNNPNPTPYVLNSAEINTALGFSPVNPVLLANANGIATLGANGQLSSSQIPASLVGAVVYQGAWNASTNVPALASGTGTKGWYYIVSVAGTTNLDGITTWQAGDWAIFDGSKWDLVQGTTNVVQSVFGRTGVVVMSATDVSNALTFTPYNATNPNAFINAATLPVASTSVLGGVKVDGTTIVINATTNQISGGAAIPATYLTLGSVSVDDYTMRVSNTGHISVPLGDSNGPGIVQIDGTTIQYGISGVDNALGVTPANGATRGIVGAAGGAGMTISIIYTAD